MSAFSAFIPILLQKCTGEVDLSWFCLLPSKEIDFKKENILKTENLTKIQTSSLKKIKQLGS